MIVIVHIDYNQDFYIISNYIARIAVPFFFTISGYVFAKKIKNSTHSNYIKKLILTYFQLFVFYIPLGLIQLQSLSSSIVIDDNLINQIWHLIMVVFVYGSSYHLWYLPALIFSLSCLCHLFNKATTHTLLLASSILYIIGSLETYYYILPHNVQDIMSIYFKYFITTRNGLFFGLFFTTLGYYIERMNPQITQIKSKLMLASVALVIEWSIVNNLSQVRDYNFYITLIPFIYLLFNYSINTNISFDTRAFSKTSKLIYFYHIMIIYTLEFTFAQLNISLYFTNPLYRLALVLSVLFAFLEAPLEEIKIKIAKKIKQGI
jgi:serine/alanine racemase